MITITTLVVAIIVIGILFFAAGHIPLPEPFKTILTLLVCLLAIGILIGAVPLPAFN